MNCPKCGRVCPIDANFCARCGARLEHENVTFDQAEEPVQENDLRPLSANPVRLETGARPEGGARPKRKPLFEDYEPVEEIEKPKKDAGKVTDDSPTAVYKRPKALREQPPKAEAPKAETIKAADKGDVDVFRARPAGKTSVKKKVQFEDDDFGWDEDEEETLKKGKNPFKYMPGAIDDEEDELFGEEEEERKPRFSLFRRKKKDEREDYQEDDEEEDAPKERETAPRRKPLPAANKPVSHIRPVSQDKPMEDPVFLFEDEEEDEEEEGGKSGVGLKILALLTLVALAVFGVYFFKYTDTGRRWQASWGISKDPSDYIMLGNYHMQRGSVSEAAKDYYAAFSHAYSGFDYDLNDYQLSMNVAQGLVNATDYDRAVRLYKFIIDHWAQEKEPVEKLLALYQTLGMTAEYDELLSQKRELVAPQTQETQVETPETSQGGAVAAPKPTVPGGSYDSTVQIGLSAAQGAEIYYTLDGSKPDANSRKYDGFIILDGSATYLVRAIAVKDGVTSPEMTETYHIQMD